MDPRVHTNAMMERELKILAAKGVMKVFSALKKFRGGGE